MLIDVNLPEETVTKVVKSNLQKIVSEQIKSIDVAHRVKEQVSSEIARKTNKEICKVMSDGRLYTIIAKRIADSIKDEIIARINLEELTAEAINLAKAEITNNINKMTLTMTIG